MDRTQFTFYDSFFKAVSRIKKKADRADAYDAICAYALYETEPDLDTMPDAAAIAFELIKPNLNTSRRKATSGKAGGSTKQTGSKAEAKSKQTASKKENKKENKREIENKKEKENECSPPTPSPDTVQFGPELQEAAALWIKYKTEKGQQYKPTGLKSLMTEIGNNAEKYGETAVADLIRTCMASNWQGIIFDRLKAAPAGRSTATSSNPFLDMLEEKP